MNDQNKACLLHGIGMRQLHAMTTTNKTKNTVKIKCINGIHLPCL